MEIYLLIVILLFSLAVSDLIVGVSNDAVNFLNSSIGSKVAPRWIIMIIASIGILAGVTFSSGMMEVARKGIFCPEYFHMPEIMIIFLAVMLTDILLLDLFNTFGFPTSTTVSIVFELLGAAVAMSFIKLHGEGHDLGTLTTYINTDKALAIIVGILLSVFLAFFFGMVVQFISRVLFTFDYESRLRRYGALWGGAALSVIIYFILIKGAKGASFITPETAEWIMGHTLKVLVFSFLASAGVLQAFVLFTKVHILKIIVLFGTFALAMAFAANDLVNFIGVPLAGLATYTIAKGTPSPLTVLMTALKEPVHTETYLLLAAGAIMVATLWISRKARSVTETEVRLGRQEEGVERFGSSHLSRSIVRSVSWMFEAVKTAVPEDWRREIARRMDPDRNMRKTTFQENPPSFDLLRASVNLTVASALVSFATSLKLPLSTTYVTFMVAMGSSLSDQAWGRESASYRVAGVLAVIGGWFFTAFSAFTMALAYALLIHFLGLKIVPAILALSLYVIWRNYHVHRRRMKEVNDIEVFDLKRLNDAEYGITKSFEHSGYYLRQINRSLNRGYDALFIQNRQQLRRIREDTKLMQRMANVIIANIFKTLRLLQSGDVTYTQVYYQTISALQEIAESHRDSVIRAFLHVDNYHKGLLKAQIRELQDMRGELSTILDQASKALMNRQPVDWEAIEGANRRLVEKASEYNNRQIVRIQAGASKTRLSVLFYGLMWDIQKISHETLELLKVFQKSFESDGEP